MVRHIKRHLKDEKIGERILELVQRSYDETLGLLRDPYEEILRTNRVLLSRAERDRLLQLVAKDLVHEMVDQL